MSNFIADKKREHEAAAERAVAAKEYSKAFFHVTKAAEFTLKLAEQCGGKLGLGYADDAHGLLDVAQELKELMEQELPPKKKILNRHQETKESSAEKGDEGDRRWQSKSRPTERLADVAGLDEVKRELQEKVIGPFQNPKAYEHFKVKGGGGVLMYGPPGTGKTFLAKAVAGELDAAFFNVNAAQIKNKYVGESEKNIESLFQEARQHKRSIIFIDECDAILGRKGNQKVNTVNQFLTMMDGFDKNENLLMILAATNRPEALDSAITRPGRLGSRIYVGPPDLEARKAIILGNMKGAPMDDDLPIDEIAEETEGYSGADMAAICNQMKLSALTRQLGSSDAANGFDSNSGHFTEKVNIDDAQNALDRVKPSITEEMIAHYHKWNDEQKG